ncbi:hypothetical protein LCGC14_2094090, partial [marine sediment metagenome]
MILLLLAGGFGCSYPGDPTTTTQRAELSQVSRLKRQIGQLEDDLIQRNLQIKELSRRAIRL